MEARIDGPRPQVTALNNTAIRKTIERFGNARNDSRIFAVTPATHTAAALNTYVWIEGRCRTGDVGVRWGPSSAALMTWTSMLPLLLMRS